MKIVILGNSGSGKSTLASRIAGSIHAQVLDLDTVAWEPGEIAHPRPEDAALADVQAFCQAHEAWVVEGCYANLIVPALTSWPLLLLLDPGTEACVANCRARPWEPHKYASKAEQDGKLTFLLEWVASYEQRDDAMSRLAHEAVFEHYAGPKRRLTELPGEALLSLIEAPKERAPGA